MKKILTKSLVFAVAIFLSVFFIAPAMIHADSSNLVENGDFSSGNLYGGWNTVGDVSIYNDEGNNVAKCVSTSSQSTDIYHQVYPTTNNLSFSVKIKPVSFSSGNIQVYVALFSGGNFLENAALAPIYYPGGLPTGSWTTLSGNLSGYPSFDMIILGAIVNGDNTVYFDDFTVTGNAVNAPSAPSSPLTTEFVKTLYDNILGRVPDDGGLNNWVTALNNGTITLGDVVYNFVFSKELEPIISVASPEDFVTFLYENVLDRSADPDGYAGWVSAMKNGMSKEDVLLHFIDSDEFKNICTMFGLTQ